MRYEGEYSCATAIPPHFLNDLCPTKRTPRLCLGVSILEDFTYFSQEAYKYHLDHLHLREDHLFEFKSLNLI
jgi:hypothetical protein